MNRCAKIALVSQYHRIVIFPFDVIQIMNVVNAGSSHIIRVDYAFYATDGVKLIPVIMKALSCAIAPVGSGIGIVFPHRTSFGSGILTYLNRFGINTENILGTVNGNSYILSNFFSQTSRQLSAGIELPAANQVGQFILTLFMET